MDARKHLLVVLLSVVAFLATVDAVCNFNEPLGDPYPDEDFVKVEYNKEAYITQIELDENYPNETQKNVRIAVFNCDETDVPTIGQFSLGSQMSLGLETENNDSKWYLIVTNAQDYENPSQRDYVFVVRAGVEQLDVALSIRNLDDESPYFLPVNTTSCEIKETQTGQTSCFLLANDPDAIMDNMKFRVLEGGDISENISLVVVNDVDFCKPAVPKDCFTVALYIKAELEFINKPVYSLLLEVEDQAGHVGNLPYIVQVIPENKEIPHFTPQQLIIELDEETPGIVFTNKTITASDRDALDFGQFYLTLGGDGSDDCYTAFDVIPRAGYRDADVKLSVINPKKLDYDEGSCNNIIVKIIATEITDATRTGEAEVNVQLIDLNDEPPIFEEKEYVFSAEEHTPKGTHLGFVKANDRDAFDTITYSLASTAYLNVDPVNGSVTVNADFNYHRQPQVFATVRADDTATPPHFDLAQITVNVTDINDMRPVLIMPWSPANIDENPEFDPDNATVLNVTITASDEDTDPDLSFSIDWENSRAAKQGFPVKKEEFEDCLRIETLEDPDDPLAVVAVLKVNRIIHWEVFDTLYVNIIVDDNNTHPDYQQNRNTSAMLTVAINDINDCYPQFNEIRNLTFKENTEEGQLFEIITATDEDGPGFNEVKYYLINDLYKEEYVTINSISGELRTGKDKVDFEQIEVLNYTVVATDGELENQTSISIEIEDVNDNAPYFIGNYSEIYLIPENNTARMHILKFEAHDNDTSPQFHTLTFFVETKYKGLFEVDSVTGEVYVPEGAGGSLDYEDVNTYSIEYTVRDRCEEGFCYPDSLSSSIRISIHLTDINDNPPVIQNAGKLAAIGEDGAPGVQLGYVIATDADSDENADLTFDFIGFEPERGQELFAITKVDLKRASIAVKSNMLDKWGNYTLTVWASDGLFEDTADFIIEVIDINNNEPVFVFPNKTTVLRFNIFENIPGNVLSDVNGNKMFFSAIDDKDNGLNGTAGMKYSVTGDDIATKYLAMVGDELRLIEDFDADMSTNFKLQLKACDGEFPSAQQCTVIETEVRLRMNKEYEPTFDEREWETDFTENKTGLEEVRHIEVPVTDLNNGDCDGTEDDCELQIIYYFILDGDKETFDLHPENGTLSLKKELDREEVDKHYLVVVVTNLENGPPLKPDENSTLKVTIKVNDVIDTAPQFNNSLVAAGITVGDKVNDVVTNLIAVSFDLNDKLTYSIIDKSMNVTDVSLQHLVGKNPFKINDDQLQLNFDVQDSSMKGMFFFKVLVTNLGDLTDEAVCQVYVISEEYLVPMRFKNNVSFVESKSKQIAVIYSDIFKYQSNVKKIARSVDSNGTPLDDLTDVTSNFVDAEGVKPIPKEEITKKVNDKQTFNDLRAALWKEELDLDSIDNTSNQAASMEGVLQIILIVVSVVLGTLVIVLFAAFFIRTRSLNRRLEALSTTKFGSQDSGLNRIGMAVPNTNQHAVEGSNPIWGNDDLAARNFDNASLSSGDSDLIGVEENPEFSPYGNSGVANDGFTHEPATDRRMSVNPMFAAGLSQLSAVAPQGKATVGRSVNPLADMQNNDAYDSGTDSRRASENVADKNSNFTFSGRMDSMPTTEL